MADFQSFTVVICKNTMDVVQIFQDYIYKVCSHLSPKFQPNWTIYPNYGHTTRHYPPNSLLLCCDNIKDYCIWLDITLTSSMNLDVQSKFDLNSAMLSLSSGQSTVIIWTIYIIFLQITAVKDWKSAILLQFSRDGSWSIRDENTDENTVQGCPPDPISKIRLLLVPKVGLCEHSKNDLPIQGSVIWKNGWKKKMLYFRPAPFLREERHQQKWNLEIGPCFR